jgi:hypothetical protein
VRAFIGETGRLPDRPAPLAPADDASAKTHAKSANRSALAAKAPVTIVRVFLTVQEDYSES